MNIEKELVKMNKILKKQDDMYAFKKRPYPVEFIELAIDDEDKENSKGSIESRYN